MPRLIAYNKEQESFLEEKLNGTIYNNVQFFIEHYNAGIFNKSAQKVAEIAEEIKNTYENITLRNNFFNFKSADQIQFENIQKNIQQWQPIIKMKNDIKFYAELNHLEDSKIIVIIKNKAYTHDTETDSLEPLKTDAFNKDNVELILQYSSLTPTINSEKHYKFLVSDFLKINTDFIEEIAEILPSAPEPQVIEETLNDENSDNEENHETTNTYEEYSENILNNNTENSETISDDDDEEEEEALPSFINKL